MRPHSCCCSFIRNLHISYSTRVICRSLPSRVRWGCTRDPRRRSPPQWPSTQWTWRSRPCVRRSRCVRCHTECRVRRASLCVARSTSLASCCETIRRIVVLASLRQSRARICAAVAGRQRRACSDSRHSHDDYYTEYTVMRERTVVVVAHVRVRGAGATINAYQSHTVYMLSPMWKAPASEMLSSSPRRTSSLHTYGRHARRMRGSDI